MKLPPNFLPASFSSRLYVRPSPREQNRATPSVKRILKGGEPRTIGRPCHLLSTSADSNSYVTLILPFLSILPLVLLKPPALLSHTTQLPVWYAFFSLLLPFGQKPHLYFVPQALFGLPPSSPCGKAFFTSQMCSLLHYRLQSQLYYFSIRNDLCLSPYQHLGLSLNVGSARRSFSTSRTLGR